MPRAAPASPFVAFTRRPIVRGAAWTILAGLGTGFFLQMYARMARASGNDLGARLAAARILVEGGDPYTLEMSQGHGPYPLTIDVLAIPLTWIPLVLAQTLWFALSVGALVASKVLELYRDGWVPEVAGLTSGPVAYEWRTRFTLAAVLTEIWPRLASVAGLRYAAAAAVVGPMLWIQPRLARDPRGTLFLFALYLAAMPLVSPVSETHHLAMLAGSLWIWLLAAGTPPHMPTLDGVGAGLVLGGHWLGVALAGPAAGRRGSLFDGLTLLALYLILLVRSVRTAGDPVAPAVSGRAGPS
jgi:hypothetical protein